MTISKGNATIHTEIDDRANISSYNLEVHRANISSYNLEVRIYAVFVIIKDTNVSKAYLSYTL